MSTTPTPLSVDQVRRWTGGAREFFTVVAMSDGYVRFRRADDSIWNNTVANIERYSEPADAIERDICAEHDRTLAAHMAAEKRVEDFFAPLVKAALEAGDLAEARRILGRMPEEGVAWVFAMDRIRQAPRASGQRQPPPWYRVAHHGTACGLPVLLHPRQGHLEPVAAK